MANKRQCRPKQSVLRKALVIVHPSWPRVEPSEKDFRRRCDRTAERIRSAAKKYPTEALYLVPTYRCGSSAADREAAQFGVLACNRAAFALTEEELAQAASWLGFKLRRFSQVTIAGFYWELCCSEIAHGLRAAGFVVSRPLSLTRYSPRQVSHAALHASTLPDQAVYSQQAIIPDHGHGHSPSPFTNDTVERHRPPSRGWKPFPIRQ